MRVIPAVHRGARGGGERSSSPSTERTSAQVVDPFHRRARVDVIACRCNVQGAVALNVAGGDCDGNDGQRHSVSMCRRQGLTSRLMPVPVTTGQARRQDNACCADRVYNGSYMVTMTCIFSTD